MTKFAATLVALFMARLATLACVGAAAYLAANGISGWGWFLAIALFTL